MDERRMQDFLRAALDVNERQDAMTEALDELNDEIVEILSFEDAGVMTMNKGLVVRTADGAEFQVTIVQSRGS